MIKLLLYAVVIFCSISLAPAHAEDAYWVSEIFQKSKKCFQKTAVSINMLGQSNKTSDISIHCYNKYQNQHKFQLTHTSRGENRDGTEFDADTFAWQYKDFYRDSKGKLDVSVLNIDDLRGYVILGIGYGKFTKFPDGEPANKFDALFMSFGWGLEYHLGNSFFVAGDLGYGLGGLATDRYVTLNMIYKIN